MSTISQSSVAMYGLIPGLSRYCAFFATTRLINKFSLIRHRLKRSFKVDSQNSAIPSMFRNYKYWINIGFITGFESILSSSAVKIDIFMLSIYSSSSLFQIGNYTAASKFYIIFLPVVFYIVNASISVLNDLKSKSSIVQLRNFVLKRFMLTVFLLLTLSTILFVASPLIPYIVGAKYTSILPLVRVFSLVLFTHSTTIFLTVYLKTINGGLSFMVYNNMVVLVINLLLNYVFIVFLDWGALGASYATLLSYTFQSLSLGLRFKNALYTNQFAQ